MTNEILVEGIHHHGAKIQNGLVTKLRRKLRPKHTVIGKLSAPFDWEKGFDVEAQLGRKLTIKNQGQSSSCWGQASSRLREIQGISIPEQSAKSAYSRCYASGGGVYLTDGEHQYCLKGFTNETDVPSYENATPPSEAYMEDVTWLTDPLQLEALSKSGFTPVTVAIDIDSIASAMEAYGGVIFTVQGQNNGSWLSQYPVHPTGNTNLWGHYVVSKSAQMVNGIKEISFYNSWGDGVGVGGVQTFREDYINSGYIVDCVAFVPIALTTDQVSVIQGLLVKVQGLLLSWKDLTNKNI